MVKRTVQSTAIQFGFPTDEKKMVKLFITRKPSAI